RRVLFRSRVEADREKATASYQSVLEIDPGNVVALVNLALLYNQTRRYQLAEDLALRAMAVGDQVPSYAQAFYAQVSQGKFAAEETTLARLARRLPEARQVWTTRARFAATKGDFATAALTYDSLLRMEQGLNWRALAYDGLADVALARGRLADAERYRREAMAANEAWGVPAACFKGALRLGSGGPRQRGGTARAPAPRADWRMPLGRCDGSVRRRPVRFRAWYLWRRPTTDWGTRTRRWSTTSGSSRQTSGSPPRSWLSGSWGPMGPCRLVQATSGSAGCMSSAAIARRRSTTTAASWTSGRTRTPSSSRSSRMCGPASPGSRASIRIPAAFVCLCSPPAGAGKELALMRSTLACGALVAALLGPPAP